MNSYKHPNSNILGKLSNKLLNQNRLKSWRRKVFSVLPFPILTSDITDVVYMNWFVDAKIARKYIPKGIEVFEYDGRILFTILTYNHHNFGPRFTGIFRKLFPSPLQSNWRFYVKESPLLNESKGVVLFLKNIMGSTLYTLGSRLLSDALPSHLPQKFTHQKTKNGYFTKIISGTGSAPELQASLELTNKTTLPPIFQNCFGSLENTIDYICMQGSAICSIPKSNKIAHAGITLPIDISTIKYVELKQKNIPFLNEMDSNHLEAFCFVVPNIKFDVLWETTLN